MSSFEITGTVSNVQNLTSSKGNAYITFQVKDVGGPVFELSLFGDLMQFAEKLETKKPLVIKGVLGSREFQDKNGKTRYGIELKPSWIEESKKGESKKSAEVSTNAIESIPF